MKRRTFLVAAGAASLLAVGPAGAETLVVLSPGDGYLNLRTGPGANFTIIRRMANGSRVETLEWAGRWVRVRHESGAVGWAHADYLRTPSTNWRRVYSPGDGYLNLRAGPGTGYGILLRMYNGERMQVLAGSGNWRFVRHQSGTEGWAYADYLVR